MKKNNRITLRVDKLVYETFTGDKLTEDDCIRHINGDNSDNRLENLQKIKKSEYKNFKGEE